MRGKVIHIPAGRLYEGEITMGYDQFFKIGDGFHAVSKSWTVKAVNGEAEFVTAPLYDNAVSIQTGERRSRTTGKGFAEIGRGD